ncbi:DNA mismatch repair protein MutS [Paenibacillus endophyticus]|uniref:DNA mismatch repair protein MutS n=1 Tax=Paenibacillus endophyticus TaxID=1294268 RepID=A0A7W5C5S1_9BACL|nr:DNA mismatch repair protein MutS [Paenibacillus endophyticus]MBB3151683.1 DNA mismatch repair protein MutS [Paenibacillus endophyticus]
MAGYTPMILQYLAIKEEAKDAFLFFRLGDFYEMFFDDAIAASRELEITLTGREGGGEKKIPMCGVPYHSAENYISRLVDKGYKVAICEQVEDPAAAKGVVRREIVRIITPGTVMETKALDGNSNNFIAAIVRVGGILGLSACDLSTGEFYVTSFPEHLEALIDEINVYQPSELVGDDELLARIQAAAVWNRQLLLTARQPMATDKLLEQFGEAEIAKVKGARLQAVSVLTGYLEETQKRSLGHVRAITSYEPNQFMILDHYTRRNLELTETVRDRSKKGSLLWLLDRTQTSMGARLLRRWIDKPLLSSTAVEARLDAVETLYLNLILRDDIRSELQPIYDLERLVGRVAFGSANGRDLNALRSSLRRIPQLTELCEHSGSDVLKALVDGTDNCSDLADLIETVLVDEPPVTIKEGGLIRAGYDAYLDQLREASTNGKKWLAELERQEREATGIKNLKIGYNRIFGYYLEVSKGNLSSLPEGRYERKQTLANAERFVTPELKEKEKLILEAEDKMVDLEYERFIELRDHLSLHLHRLQKAAAIIAELDVYQSLATVSAERRFSRPKVTEGYNLHIEDGKHPVVEAMMDGIPFISNGTALHKDEQWMLLITGPNMAGKSTYMRQVALICIMAQIGCFVPAKSAEIPLIDRIFTRIGAADDLIGGQSTFMVEMKDIQIMTDKATANSLVIIDELGRGTSTGEGMAIAQAVIEYVHHHIGCKALVSTHFHELAHLEESLPSLANARMAVEESGDNVTFLRKLIAGAASTSYGIYCAQLAGLPESIIGRAYELLDETLDGETTKPAPKIDTFAYAQTAPAAEFVKEAVQPKGIVQLSIFDEPAAANEAEPARKKASPKAEQLAEQLRKLDLFNLTPMQAMQWLNDMKSKLNN